MLTMHKELVSDFFKRDQVREEKIRSLIQEISQVTKENVALKLENKKLRDILHCRFVE